MTSILALCCAVVVRAETNAPPAEVVAPAPVAQEVSPPPAPAQVEPAVDAPAPVSPPPAPAPDPSSRPSGPPGLGANEDEVRFAHGDPDGVFRFKNRCSFMYAKRGRFEFEDGVVVRMKWDGVFSSVQAQPVLASQPYTVEIRPEVRAPGTRPNERVLRKSDGRYEIVTNRPPAAVRSP